MERTCIEILPQHNLKTIFNKSQYGAMAQTFSCNIEWENGDILKSYIKRFPREKPLGILNEITGYVIAKGCDLPIAQHAGLIKVSPEIFGNDKSSPDEWCFIVSSVPGDLPVTLYEANMITECQSLMNLIAAWSKVSETIAFDDWTANEDRHLGNILVAGKDNIFLIDHSNLPITIDWQAMHLNPAYQSRNILAQNLWGIHATPLPVKSKIAVASQRHQDIFARIRDELYYWWDLFLENDVARLNALKQFVEIRANSGRQRISSNFNLLAV
ncbi:hypothetical protein [Aeromonas caviae]|uniref:hypothetical protein n=1 Tax=Aeromonas caviae TaxID=648 RepID=UPI002B475252|nr:hypothetical protein [Aeromonas caviae]